MSTPNNIPPTDLPQETPSRDLIPAATPRFYVTDLGGGQAQSHPSTQGFSAALVLHTLRQWWKWTVPLGLVLAGLAGGLVYVTFKPTYEASAWLRIEDMRPYIAFPSHEDSRRFIATQVELIKSPLVLGPVLSNPDVSALAAAEEEVNDPLRWLATVRVQSVGQSELYKISFSSHDPNGSALVVNAVVDSYFELQRKDEAQQVERVIDLLTLESDSRAKEVTRLREAIRTLQEEAVRKDPFARNADSDVVIGHPLGNLQAQLANADVERAVLEAQVTAREESLFGLGVQTTTTDSGATVVRLRGDKNDFALTTGPTSGVTIVLEHEQAAGDQALVRFDAGAGALYIDVDPRATTANSLIAAISAEGTFAAALDGKQDDGNDGTGLVCQVEASADPATVERAVEQHPDVQAMKRALMANEARLQDLKTKLAKGVDNPLYRQFEQQVEQEEEKFKQICEQLRARVQAERKRAAANEQLSALAEMQSQLANKSLLVDLLSKRCKVQSENVSASSGDSVDLGFLRDELARAQQVFELIESRIVKLRTEQRAPARVTRLQGAEPPSRPVEVWPYKHIALASLAGLCFPFLLAVGWERIVRRVSDPTQLEIEAHLPVVGEVARMPSGRHLFADPSSRRLKEGFGLFEESIDSLRTSLILSEPLRNMKVLSVTSAANNEGKTSVAVQLAVSIARACGEMVLLVDGDMRSPDIHRLLGVPLEPGLAEVLSRRCEPKEAIATNWGKKVHVLSAGKLRGSPHRLLGNGVLKALLDEITLHYRYIIIDTPPVLAASESLVFARAADANILCTMRDVSRVDQVKRTRDRLSAAGARTAGLVLNGVPVNQYAYRYGNYYGYQRR